MLVAGWATPCFPSTSSASATVGATVVASCSLAATTLAFGVYQSVLLDATSTITVTCTSTTPYTVGLNNGLYGGRRLGGPVASRLPYLMYRNAARTQSWGTTIGTDTLAGVGNGEAQNLTVYGRIAGGQLKNPGAYSDTVTITVTY